MDISTVAAVIILIILIPQIYYWKKKYDYKTLNNGVKFFVRHERRFEDHRELYLTNTDGHDIFVRVYEVENPKAILHASSSLQHIGCVDWSCNG